MKGKKSIWNVIGKNPTLIGTLLWVLCMPLFMCNSQIKNKERWMIFKIFTFGVIAGYLVWRYLT